MNARIMKLIHPMLLAIVVFTLVTLPSAAFGVSSTSIVATEGKPVTAEDGWPRGVLEIINDPLRTVGWNPWFSEWPNDINHYGMRVRNMDDINQLIAKLARVAVTNAEVALRPEKEVGSLGFSTVIDKGNGLAATFSLGNQKRINEWFERLEKKKSGAREFGVHKLDTPPEALPPRLTLYVGHAVVDLEKIKLPKNVKLISDVPEYHRKNHPDDPLVQKIDAFLTKRGTQHRTEK